MTNDLYIYYRARTTDADQLSKAVLRMQQELTDQYGISSALKRRPHIQNDMHTWMEVYLAAPDDFENTLSQAVSAYGLSVYISGERHVEHFVDVASCV